MSTGGAPGDARLRELAAAIAACPPTADGVSFERLLPDVRAELCATHVGVNRPVPTADGWAFELDALAGIPRSELARLRAPVLRHTGRWTAYDPLLPEQDQRNVALVLSELPDDGASRDVLRRMFRAIGQSVHDQIRVLVCEGPTFLGWFGAFRDEPFSARDRERLAALVPAVRRALRADALARRAALLQDALATSLALLEDPAFLIDVQGRIRHANPRGVARVDRDPRVRELLVDVARGARPRGALVQPLEARHAMIVVLRTPGPDPGSRLALARREWGLTPRQTEVLGLVLRGRSNKEIAAELACSEGNVEAHLTQIFRKAGADGRADLVARAWAL